jgi:hypothetical protein
MGADTGRRGLHLMLISICVMLAGCTYAHSKAATFEQEEIDFYRAQTDAKSDIFLDTLRSFQHDQEYRVAIGKLNRIIPHEDKWLVMQRLIPTSHIFELSGLFKVGRTWTKILIDSDGASHIANVDNEDAISRIEKIWSPAPSEDRASGLLQLTDSIVVYVSICCKAGKVRRVAIVNPGFEQKTPKTSDGMSLEIPLDQNYLQASKFVSDVAAVMGP